MTDTEITRLVDDRTQARQQKNFRLADSIRQTIEQHHISIEDRPDGTTHWYKFRRYV